ncbi:hypothetical protein [Mycobacterium sp. NPDC050853]|uniref:hypothetical protein n=1 Tax=Mycobacterium sp. NPDC050853 TaxID=3155160 RepID=UPI0033CA2ED9
MSHHILSPGERVGDAPPDEAEPQVSVWATEISARIGTVIATATPTGTNPMQPWDITANIGDAVYEFPVLNVKAANAAINALAQAYAHGREAVSA